MKTIIYQIKNALLLLLLIAAATGAKAQCNTPTTLTLTQLSTCDSIRLNWNAVPGVVNYIYTETLLPNTPTAGNSATTTTGKLGGLLPGTLYYIWVKANCAGGSSTWVRDTIRTCGTATCQPPLNISYTNLTTTSVDVSWGAAPGAIGYEYKLDQTFADPTSGATATTGLTSSFNGLTPGTMYYFHLRTRCGANDYSPWAPGMPMITYAGTQCDSPASITNTVPTCDSVRIEWAPVAFANGYAFAVTTSATPPSNGSYRSVPNAVRGNLAPSTTYYTHVFTFCSTGGTGMSGWATKSFVTPSCGGNPPVCNMPATVNLGTVTTNTASVNWTVVAGAVGYEYVMNTSPTTPGSAGTPVTAINLSVPSLTPNTTYYFHVRTKCAGNIYSAWKAPVQLHTLSTTTGISTTGSTLATIYPNPAGNTLVIELDKTPAANAQVEIFSMDGRKVLTLQPAVKMQADVQRLQSGIYYIRLTDKEHQEVMKFTKE